jgi:nucleoside-diphosphate-sugar epimerase
MLVAITGHSAGIGQAMADIFRENGHEVRGLSRRNGYNIRSTPKIVSAVQDCDMFINNAQIAYAQTELLFDLWSKWRDQKKYIVNVSTQMTDLNLPPMEGWDHYLIQKKTLEMAAQLLSSRNIWPKQILLRPGAVATQPGQTAPEYQDPTEYAREAYAWIVKSI